MITIHQPLPYKGGLSAYSVYNNEDAQKNNPVTIGLAGLGITGLSRELRAVNQVVSRPVFVSI